jgi:MFS family permease
MKPAVLAIATLCIALSALDAYAVNSLLLVLSGELDGTGVGVVAFSYSVVATISALFAGAAVDRWGAPSTLILSLALFGLGAALCATAPSMNLLSFGRAVQGAGGGALTVGAIALLTARVESRTRVRYLSNLGLLFAVCSVLGPGVAALMHEAWSWRAFFAVQVPLVLIAMAWLRSWSGHEGRPDAASRRPFGVLSGLRLSLLIGVSVFWFHFAPMRENLISPMFYVATIALVLLVVGVVGWERRDGASLLPTALFHSTTFRLTNVLLFCSAMTSLGLAALVPYYVQAVSGATVAQGGLSASSIVFGTMTGSLLAGRTAARVSSKVLVTSGFLTSAAGYLLLGLADRHFALPAVVCAIFLVGAGYGMVMPQLTSRAQGLADPKEHGAATAFASVSRSFGGVVGVATFGALVFTGAAGLAPDLLPRSCQPMTTECAAAADAVRGAFRIVVMIGGAILCLCASLSATAVGPQPEASAPG